MVLIAIAGHWTIGRQQAGIEERSRQWRVSGTSSQGVLAARDVGIQTKGRAGAVGQKEVLLIVIRDHRGQRTWRQIKLRFQREVDVLLLVLRLDVIEIHEVMSVGVLPKEITEPAQCRFLQSKGCIEVDRTRLQHGDFQLGIKSAVIAQCAHETTTRACFFKEIDAIITV